MTAENRLGRGLPQATNEEVEAFESIVKDFDERILKSPTYRRAYDQSVEEGKLFVQVGANVVIFTDGQTYWLIGRSYDDEEFRTLAKGDRKTDRTVAGFEVARIKAENFVQLSFGHEGDEDTSLEGVKEGSKNLIDEFVAYNPEKIEVILYRPD